MSPLLKWWRRLVWWLGHLIRVPHVWLGHVVGAMFSAFQAGSHSNSFFSCSKGTCPNFWKVLPTPLFFISWNILESGVLHRKPRLWKNAPANSQVVVGNHPVPWQRLAVFHDSFFFGGKSKRITGGSRLGKSSINGFGIFRCEKSPESGRGIYPLVI